MACRPKIPPRDDCPLCCWRARGSADMAHGRRREGCRSVRASVSVNRARRRVRGDGARSRRSVGHCSTAGDDRSAGVVAQRDVEAFALAHAPGDGSSRHWTSAGRFLPNPRTNCSRSVSKLRPARLSSNVGASRGGLSRQPCTRIDESRHRESSQLTGSPGSPRAHETRQRRTP
jgi:hypothetical protein